MRHTMPRLAVVLTLAAAAVVAARADIPPPPAVPFSGRYRLTLGFGPGCRASVSAVSVELELEKRGVSQGTEIDGRPTRADETRVGQIVLLQQGTSAHGPFATLGGRASREPITTREGLLVMPWLMLDGTVNGAAGSASGTAIGVLQVGRPEDEVPNTLGSCTATDHTWSLEPL